MSLVRPLPSAQFVCIAELKGHVLKFHKPSKKDGSGKCDADRTGDKEDRVYGAIFSILESEFPMLDKCEGRGYGYERKIVTVLTENFGEIQAQTYLATKFDSSLRPLDWYKEHVIRGAKSVGLPSRYIASIEAVECVLDIDATRRANELAIYR